ncbi:carbohydrate sulfotransferase 11-like [Saccoglossus kowalevskii]|uniref:Carbohydrate sulfotransferase n=1 Tax=Saccoglossus kowalevskii TaxID=10224 RepID=A0ABM0GUL2_SACKO|nr:PREDICTED: carbohydrate sulfotransferase 10-like [Saccoglossus kowalevskii]
MRDNMVTLTRSRRFRYLISMVGVFFGTIYLRHLSSHAMESVIDKDATSKLQETTAEITPDPNAKYEKRATEMVERQDALKAACREMTNQENDFHLRSSMKVFVDEKHRLLTCLVKKVASTSWKRVFLVLLGFANSSQINDDFDFRWEKMVVKHGRQRVTVKSLNSKIFKNYVKFLFVRHPFTRLLSAYRDKFERQRSRSGRHEPLLSTSIKNTRDAIMKRYNLSDSYSVTFPLFVRYLSDSNVNNFDAHWAPIYKSCTPCTIKYDVIGRYEELNEDADFVLHASGIKHLNFPDTVYDIGQRTDSSHHQIMKHYFSQLSHEEVMRLYEIYEWDFKLFGYPYPFEFLQMSEEDDE